MSFAPESVEARLEPESAYVGETVIYRLEVVRPEDVAIRVPADLDLSPLSLNGVAHRAEAIGDGRVRDVIELEVGVYTLEDAEIPAISLEAVTEEGATTITFAPMTIAVRSLVDEQGDTPRELAPPDTVWIPDYGILKAAGVALAVFLVVLLLLKALAALRGRPKKAVPPPPPAPPRPAHIRALEALEALRAEGLVASGERKRFYFRLSEIVREYLGERYGFESLELTTTELLAHLRDRPTPGLDHARFGAWCADCDLVKFANHAPTDAECNTALTAAFAFVEETRPRDPSAAADAGVAAGSAGGAS
jgi:hypothetical protein